MVCTVKEVKRVNSTKNARSKLKLDAINFNKDLNDEQRVFVANRIIACIESNRLNFEVYYRDDVEDRADIILDKLQNIFQTTEEMVFDIRKCKLGIMGEVLDSSESAAVLKRIKEIEKTIVSASETTACIILLPGKEKSLQGDVQDDGGCFVWDLNDNGQLAVDWKMQAVVECSYAG